MNAVHRDPLANNLQLKANICHPEKAHGFVEAEVIEGKEERQK